MYLGGEIHCESYISLLKNTTQRPGLGSCPDLLNQSTAARLPLQASGGVPPPLTTTLLTVPGGRESGSEDPWQRSGSADRSLRPSVAVSFEQDC